MVKPSVYSDALIEILSMNTSVSSLAVCLASASSYDVIPRFNLLQMTHDLTAEFKSSVDSLCQRLIRDISKGDLVLHPYDAGSKPDPHEVEHLRLDRLTEVGDQIGPLSQPHAMSLFDPGDEGFVLGLRFYAIVVHPPSGSPAYFFSTYTPKRELGRSKYFGALFERGQFDQIRRPLFLFDQNLDCFSRDDDMFILSKSGFQQAFRFYELVIKAAKASLRTIRESIPISNFDEFAASCESHLQKLAKLKNIAAKDYLDRVTMDEIKATITRKNLPVQIVVKDGQEMLLFDASNRWVILKLLDDDYLDSLMTGHSYEVTGKRVLE